MPLPIRLFFFVLGLAGAGFTIRALVSGVAIGRSGQRYTRADNFNQYAFRIFTGVFGFCVCMWIAAGLTLQDFLRPFGLEGWVGHGIFRR